MRVALLGLYGALYGAGMLSTSYYYQAGIASSGEICGPVAAATLLITVIGRGMTSPDRG
jgi:hypothetical protein